MNLSNISQIRCNGSDIVLGKLNGEVIYRKEQPVEKEYAIEYKVAVRDASDTLGTYVADGENNRYYYLFSITNPEGSSSATGYTNIEITKNDGTITNDLSTNVSDIEKVKVWYPENTIRISTSANKSYYCYVSEILNFDKMNTSNFTGLDFMFNYCTELKSIDISKWNTRKVTTILAMCQSCRSLTYLNVTNLNTSNCTDLRNVFYYCDKLTSIEGLGTWDTSSVTNIGSVFYYCTKLKNLDLSSWDTSKVTNMGSMFYKCSSLTSLDLSSWDTSNATDTVGMLAQVSHDVNWNYDGTNYQNWTLSMVDASFFGLFPWDYGDDWGYIIYTIGGTPETKYNEGKVNAYYNTSSYNYLPRIKATSSSTEATSTAVLIRKNNLTVSSSPSSTYVSDTDRILAYYKRSTYSIKFKSYSSLYLTSGITSVIYANYLGVNMSNVFNKCTFLESVDLSNIKDTSNVTDMAYMFYGCSKLKFLDLSNFDTRSVTLSTSMLSSVSTKLDWNYDGTNYQNWTLTESKASYIGTFPWNQ